MVSVFTSSVLTSFLIDRTCSPAGGGKSQSDTVARRCSEVQHVLDGTTGDNEVQATVKTVLQLSTMSIDFTYLTFPHLMLCFDYYFR